jgi:lipopolysaccharide/colanic/teichoic acid biosynthesis glycosyltransferase
VVGPRPTLRYQVERYRIELDVWYVEHRSPRLDLEILARTPLALFGGTYKGTTGGWSPSG